MRWILCGKNDAAVDCLHYLLERGDEVWVVGVAGDDGSDGWQRSLRGAAARAGLRLDQPARINDPAFVRRLSDYRANALLSIQYDQILRGPLFQSIGCPCLNLHFALLPRHRGVAPIAWAVLQGDREAGVTLHHMIEDIDAGDVIAQRSVAIEAEDTARDVYDKVSRATVALFTECYPFSAGLLSTRLSQDARGASYHRKGDFDFSRRRIEWNQPAAELHRWMRAMIFPPMQWPETTAGSRRLAVTRVAGALNRTVGGPPGTVLAKDAAGVEVAAADAGIRIRAMADPADPSVPSHRVLERVAVGDRFR
jgi:methionyl-tRNA formyltransferase